VYFVAAILLTYTFAFGDGLQSAVVTLTGRSLGAGQRKEILEYLKQALLIGTGISIVLSAVYLLGASWFYIVFRSHGRAPVRLILTREEEEHMEPDLIYEQEVLVQERFAADSALPERLKIISRYRYSDSDTLILDNYRIAYVSPDMI